MALDYDSLLKQFDLYKQIFERMPIYIYWKNNHFRYLACNEVLAQNFGLGSSMAIVGKTDFDLFPHKLACEIRKHDMEVMATGLACIFEEEGVEDNKATIYLTQKIPLFNGAGEIIGLAGISINITERKAKEEKNRIEKEEAELTLASILDNLPGHVYWKNKDSVFQGCNLAQAKSAGFSEPKSMIGKTDYEMPWSHEADFLRESDLEVMRGQKTITREEASQLANSDEVSIFLSKKSPLLNKAGEVVGILGISFDITERKKMEEELSKSQIAAEAANRAKTEFLRNMEHQLRTPFSGIYSMVEFLAETETNPEKKEQLETTYLSAKEFIEFLNDILDFTRNPSENWPVLAKKFDLKKTIEKVITMEKAAATIKQLDLNCDYEDKLPTLFIGDPRRIQRIVMNLLSNAIKFTDKGNITVSVKLGKQLDEKNFILQLLIADTGIGISSDKQNLIYEKFYRLHPANQNKYKGAGLGLNIVKQLIEDLEGEIDVISSPDKGTTFICTLPFKRPLLDELVNN
ncbi:sensory histidine-kinase / response regulator [Legionella nautarum]|uniref:histidine kinase n=1 Tax=Legionella nautarum TaxID=45070 RepID=A0A0W0WTU4_9GAMM|nr:PAS domain-containing sensor histidine kinase [Legionella nautarum]KTD35744.1 sensory histidine-kinase / response regulator [Legionella nautarum]